MKPLDPRLLRHARATRGFLVAAVAIGTASALLIVAQAFLVADAVTAAFEDGAGLSDIQGQLLALVGITIVRAGLAWAAESVGHRSAATAISQLRLQVVERALRLGPAHLDRWGAGELTALVTRGAASLDAYFARYLPQLVLAVVVPLIAGTAIVTQDPLSALIVALTIPIIPVFMILIGRYTQARVDRQWATLGVLSGHFLDVVAGLPTLKIFNRARAQAETIRRVGDQYRLATMGVLRVSFLSSMVLELIATLSVALMAVAIGLRLVEGSMDLTAGLTVLILAPEVYLPLRLVGQHFHAAAEGLGAAERMFDVLEAEHGPVGTARVEAATATIRVTDLRVAFGDRVAVPGTSLEVQPGQVTALVGPSGCGKSTLLSVLLGLVGPPSAEVTGIVEVLDAKGRAVPLADLDLPAWRAQIGWVPQSPAMLAGSVADNVRFGRGFSDHAVAEALRSAGLDPNELAEGLATRIAEGGAGVSVGQARRIGVARALLADPAILLFDEPTAALDGTREAEVGATVSALAARGRTVVVVTHRASMVGARRPRRGPDASAGVRGPRTAGLRTAGPRTAGLRTTGPRTTGPGTATRGPVGRLWRLADPDRARLALAALLATCALASAIGLLVVSAWLISRASQQPPILHLQVAIVAVRAFGLSRGLFRYAERLVGHDAAFRSLTNIRVGVYGRLERLSPAGLGEYRRGDLLARLVGDVDSSVDLIVRVALPVASGLAAGTLATAIGWAILPAAGAALAILLAVAGGLVPWLTGVVGARTQHARAAAEGQLSAQVVSHLSAAPDLLAYGAVDAAVAEVSRSDAALTALDRRAAMASGLGNALGALATGLTVAACIGLGVSALDAGQLDGVWLAALALIPLAMADVLSGMPAAALAHARVAGSAARIFQVMDAPDPVPATSPPAGVARTPAHTPDPGRAPTPHTAPAPDAALTPTPTPAPVTVALTGVAARYPGAVGDAVRGLDLDLAPGGRIALVGPSGAGKSTIAAVLLRLLDHRAGSYHLGGRDVRELGEDGVRAQLAAVDQRAHLFDTTIEENLLLANRSATPQQLRAAIEGAALADWVDALPAGLRTRVGAHGSAVSGGQAQRIALARVLLADRPIVVLDEPGEHLDPQMADQVTAAALAATEGRSVILITHRMAHTGACAEVLVLSDGAVVDRGAPEALGGWYAAAVARERGEADDG